MKAIPWKKLLPVLAAVALFYTLSLVYFNPVLEGKGLVMGDIRQWQGMAREVDEHRERTGREALWTGSMFSGMPAYQISVKWDANLLSHAHQLFSGFLPRPASFLFLYLVGMYILLLCLRVDPWLAVVGAVAFGFSSYFFIILEAGHTSKAGAIGYMPAVLGATWMLYRGRAVLGAAMLALFLGLEIAMNHVQVTYYLGILLLLFVLAELMRAVREKNIGGFVQRSGFGAAALVLALCCNLGLLWSTWEYGKYTTRGPSELTVGPDGEALGANQTGGLPRDYVTDWSYGLQESFSLLVPNVKGGASGSIINSQQDLNKITDPRLRSGLIEEYQGGGYVNTYWGDQRFTSGPVYLGAVVVLLMLLLLVQVQGRARWWVLAAVPLLLAGWRIGDPWLAAALVLGWVLSGAFLWRDTLAYALFAALVLALMLSWGRHFMPLTDFFLDLVPGYNKFRAVTIILVVVELAAPLLGVLFLHRLLKDGGWDKGTERRSLIAMGALAGLLLLLALMPGTLFDLVSERERDLFNQRIDGGEAEAKVLAFVDALKRHRQGVISADAWRSLAFVVPAAALVLLFGRRKVGRTVLLAGIGALVLIDQWAVDKRYVNNQRDKGRYLAWEDRDALAMPYRPTAADLAILEQSWGPAAQADYEAQLKALKERKQHLKGRDRMVAPEEDRMLRFASLRRHANHRVLTLAADPFTSSRESWFHRSVGGYHGAKLKRYQETIEWHLSPALMRVGGLLRSGTSVAGMDSLLAREDVLNMLNVRWIIYDNDRPPIRNLNAFGDGWFVDSIRWVKSADEEIAALRDGGLATTAVVDERFRPVLGAVQVAPDPSASVELTRYETDALTYTVRANTGGLVVFSEVHYGPDWQAYIDEVPVDHLRANYILRALPVPAGEHTVVFRLEGRAYATSRPIALAGSLLVLIGAASLLLVHARRAVSSASAGDRPS